MSHAQLSQRAAPSSLQTESSARPHSTRSLVPLWVADVASLAKSLRAAMAEHKEPPTQTQMLNWIAKGAGFQNYQSLRAASEHSATQPPQAPSAQPALTTPDTANELTAHAKKALTQFDELGRLHKWPHKFVVQRIAMWGLWLRFDAKKIYSEKDVNAVFKAWHTYGDHVTLRRELVNMKLLGRKPDGSEYWKVAQQPPEEVKAFLRALRAAQAS